jgi:hypothetical protein
MSSVTLTTAITLLGFRGYVGLPDKWFWTNVT